MGPTSKGGEGERRKGKKGKVQLLREGKEGEERGRGECKWA